MPLISTNWRLTLNSETFEAILEKTNFIVKAVLEENFLKVNYADRKDETYEVDLESSIITVENESIFLPAFAVRLYLLLNIYLNCRLLDLPYHIVRFYEGETKKDGLVDLINPELSEEESKLEVVLHDAAIKILEGVANPHDLDDDLSSFGVLHTFNLMKGLLI